jgi:hypothetical protein
MNFNHNCPRCGKNFSNARPGIGMCGKCEIEYGLENILKNCKQCRHYKEGCFEVIPKKPDKHGFYREKVGVEIEYCGHTYKILNSLDNPCDDFMTEEDFQKLKQKLLQNKRK